MTSEEKISGSDIRLVELDCASGKRSSLFYDPRNSDAATLETERPLLIAFHGGSGQPGQMEKLTGFMALAAESDFFVAYPEGINRGWNDGRDLPKRKDIDDVEFVIKLVEKLCASFPIDRKRIFACGISNGGFFVQHLALRAPGLFAAVASVAATVHQSMYDTERVSEPIAIMFVVGKDDPVIPYNGGTIELASRKAGFVVSAEHSFAYWVAANHADPRYVETMLEPIDETDQTRVFKRVYPAHLCAEAGELDGSSLVGKPVVAFIVDGGGHAWPRGWQYYRERYIGKTSQQFETSKQIIAFFLSNCAS